MLNEYINNFNSIVSFILFMVFKIILIILAILLILSLIMLAIGCLIKSQKIKSKFLTAVPFFMLLNIVFLLIPLLFVQVKKLI